MSAHLQFEDLVLRGTDGGRRLGPLSGSLAAGERCAVVGPNGAGKSSLLRLLAGRELPGDGRVLLDGQDIRRWPAVERARRIAVLGQGEEADLRLRLEDYVSLGRVPHQGRCAGARHRQAVADALAACGLSSFAGRGLHTLSGGERQRAHLARALAQEPSLLLLDEPTNHLDLRARSELLALVAGLGITVVAALHELSLVAEFAGRVLVLAGGELVAQGPPDAALEASVVERVFGLSVVHLAHPVDGRPLWVFERVAA